MREGFYPAPFVSFLFFGLSLFFFIALFEKRGKYLVYFKTPKHPKEEDFKSYKPPKLPKIPHKTRVSRKSWNCHNCNNKIPKGSTYYWYYASLGSLEKERKFCEHCPTLLKEALRRMQEDDKKRKENLKGFIFDLKAYYEEVSIYKFSKGEYYFGRDYYLD